MGINEPGQLRSHPLRGALFETWVVSEVLKCRTHRGERAGLSYYRDRNGAEIDLLVEEAQRVTLVEAKSAATPKASLFGGVRRVRPHLQAARPQCAAAVVYGGEESQQRTDGQLIPWRLAGSTVPSLVDPPSREVSGSGD